MWLAQNEIKEVVVGFPLWLQVVLAVFSALSSLGITGKLLYDWKFTSKTALADAQHTSLSSEMSLAKTSEEIAKFWMGDARRAVIGFNLAIEIMGEMAICMRNGADIMRKNNVPGADAYFKEVNEAIDRQREFLKNAQTQAKH